MESKFYGIRGNCGEKGQPNHTEWFVALSGDVQIFTNYVLAEAYCATLTYHAYGYSIGFDSALNDIQKLDSNYDAHDQIYYELVPFSLIN